MRLVIALGLSLALVIPFALMAAPSDAVRELNLYSSSKEHLVRPVLEAFEKKTGIQVNLTTLDDAALVSRLGMEGADTPADAVLVADVARLEGLLGKGLLAPIESEIVRANIPENLRAPDMTWAGVATRARLVFRRAEDEQAYIADYRELADPKWKGELLIRSSDNVYNQSLMADLLTRFGKEKAQSWAKGVARNMARRPQGGDRDQLRALASGQGRLAVSNSYYYGLMLSSDDESDRAYAKALVPMFANQTPKGGTHVNIRGIGISKYAKNKREATALAEFLAGDTAQKMLTKLNHEYPANPEIAASALLQSWGARPGANVPLHVIGAANAETIELFSRANWQ